MTHNHTYSIVLVKMLLEIVGLLVLGVALHFFLSDSNVHWRIKVNHLGMRLAILLCHMKAPATAFNRRRFEWLISLSPSLASVSAKSEFFAALLFLFLFSFSQYHEDLVF